MKKLKTNLATKDNNHASGQEEQNKLSKGHKKHVGVQAIHGFLLHLV